MDDKGPMRSLVKMDNLGLLIPSRDNEPEDSTYAFVLGRGCVGHSGLKLENGRSREAPEMIATWLCKKNLWSDHRKLVLATGGEGGARVVVFLEHR